MSSWRDDAELKAELKKALEPWARNLSVATHLRVQFRSAEKYVSKEQQFGDFWFDLAAAVWRVMAKGPQESISASSPFNDWIH